MEQTQTSSLGRFFKGLLASATSSTLMMGIFYGLQYAVGAFITATPAIALATLTAAIPSALTVIAAVTIFGGIMAAVRGDSHGASNAARTNEAQQAVLIANGRGLAPTSTPPSPDELDAPAAARWTDRTNIAQSNRTSVAQILADGKTPKDHAAAILASQQTGNAAAR